ncbi:group II intron maturase-specific domain-containing protein [Saccharopolyspora hattusasensis]|uniref:group II intron maturase-specific domain-containing protein n=1 Tax=Saccharopolyspora hattusasensis TaxID=1128679 RepID=UPI003D95D71B
MAMWSSAEPKEAKTRIVQLQVGEPGFDFLGFHHRLVRSQGRRGTGKGIVFLARWPTSKAMQHARDRIRELTERRRTLLRVEVIVEDVNRFLRGWAAYFKYGNSARHFDKIMGFARIGQEHFLCSGTPQHNRPTCRVEGWRGGRSWQ